MNYRYVEVDEVYLIHKAIISEAKTKAEVRDFTLLHSAIERPKASYHGQDLYPTIWLKAAALLHSLCQNHPFTDGNKRTAWASTKIFLLLNGQHLKTKSKEGADFMVSVDNEKLPLPTIALWLKNHSTRNRP